MDASNNPNNPRVSSPVQTWEPSTQQSPLQVEVGKASPKVKTEFQAGAFVCSPKCLSSYSIQYNNNPSATPVNNRYSSWSEKAYQALVDAFGEERDRYHALLSNFLEKQESILQSKEPQEAFATIS